MLRTPPMKMAWAAAFLIVLQFMLISVEGIGVNWGTQAAQNLPPSTIVQILKDNGISRIKLFDSDAWTVSYFAKTGIQVMLGIPNNQLASLAKSYDKAKDYVKENVTAAYKDGVDIRFKVKCQILYSMYDLTNCSEMNGSNHDTTFPAMQNVQKALNEEGYGDKIKVTTPQNADVYDSGSQGPSAGQFRSDIRDIMQQIVSFLKENDAPFLVNVYPFLSLYLNPDFPVEFAFFDGGAQPVMDNGTSYTNMLDANLDTLVWALRKAGAPKLKIILGEIGWPTDGNKDANANMARKFYNGFFKKMATKKGTPLYPGEMEYYLFSLTDENQKSIAPGDFERHWGILRYDGQPKFPMDFSGKGGEVWPVGAKDVQYLEKQWCVFNTDIKNMTLVPRNMQYACQMGDCTALNHDGSCDKTLDDKEKISYAFNMYYQMNNQDVRACNFEGLARLVDQNASTNDCLFPIGIESAGWKLGMPVGANVVVGLLLLLLLLFSH
ncbi:UNVERIFIED_CONTAM: Glucan endo-1,3-beta-glucosidase 8 [Sesamum radiatum]|uniref:Glucan endo-1,3-beta-glucosidase 8 n=1 Tax=Sesamum radiatum TaxID=300843 RepID=A0AAW2RF85_SESRA